MHIGCTPPLHVCHSLKGALINVTMDNLWRRGERGIGIRYACPRTRVRRYSHEETQVPGEGTISINTADVEELQGVRGIGPALAQSIVDYREENGEFSSTEELSSIRGAGHQAKLQKILPFVRA